MRGVHLFLLGSWEGLVRHDQRVCLRSRASTHRQDFCHAPVKHQDLTERSNHYVLWFEISMHDSVRMSKSHRVARCLKLLEALFARFDLLCIFIEAAAAHKFHCIKHAAILE